MIRYQLILVAMLFTAFGAISQSEQDSVMAEHITLYQLLKEPEEFHDKVIRVDGFFNCEFEGTVLFSTLDDCVNHKISDAVWVSVPCSNCPQYHWQRVRITGRFDMNDKGHFGAYPAAIEMISIEILE